MLPLRVTPPPSKRKPAFSPAGKIIQLCMYHRMSIHNKNFMYKCQLEQQSMTTYIIIKHFLNLGKTRCLFPGRLVVVNIMQARQATYTPVATSQQCRI